MKKVDFGTLTHTRYINQISAKKPLLSKVSMNDTVNFGVSKIKSSSTLENFKTAFKELFGFSSADNFKSTTSAKENFKIALRDVLGV